MRWWIVVALFTAGCGAVPHPPQPPPQPPEATVACVVTAAGAPIADAACAFSAAGILSVVRTNTDGYAAAQVRLGVVQLSVDAAGFAPYSSLPEGYRVSGNSTIPVTLRPLPPPHVDPASWTRADLMRFRGSLFTVEAPVPFGARPGAADNLCFFAAYFYTRQERQVCYDAWHIRAYTHGVVGPFIDPGYHGQVPGMDFREPGQADAAADLIQEVWDQHLVPIVVVVPDHWGADRGFDDHVWRVSDLRELEPIYRSERWQRLVRVVMLCWECQDGDRYGWSNARYVEYLAWLRDVFPNAIRILHTISEIEAPVGQGDELDPARCRPDQPRGVSCFAGVGEAWATVTPLIHAWFHQSSALFEPQRIDPAGDGRTNAEHWVDLWDARRADSFLGRFAGRGGFGWPAGSANPPEINNGHLCAIPGEYFSYVAYWYHRPEVDARKYGQRAVEVGGDQLCGFMDGGAEAGTTLRLRGGRDGR